MSRRLYLAAITLLGSTLPLLAEDWPQWMGAKRDAVWTESGVMQTFPKDGPKVLWRTPIGGGYAGPSVVGDRVYVPDYVTKDDILKENFERKIKLTGQERLLCLDAKTGKEIWKHEYAREYTISYPNGPRCTPTVQDGFVYALGAEGDLWCGDAATGKEVWSKNLPKEYATKTPMWGYSGHPLIHKNMLICTVGGEGSTVVAFDKATGKEIWRSLSAKEIGYAPPTLLEVAGKPVLVIWHGEAVVGLEPDTGKKLWSVAIAPRYAMSIMAPRLDGNVLFAGAVFGSAVGIQMGEKEPTATELWRGPATMKDKGLYPMNMTPFVEKGVMYGVDQPGQLRAVKIATGERLWESWRPVTGKDESAAVFCGTAFLVKNADRFWMFNENGELVIAKLSPEKYEEIGRAKLIEPTGVYSGRKVVWTHPAFANKCAYIRNDKEIIAVSLSE
jgi:outer membrane protein assembly factor BamB